MEIRKDGWTDRRGSRNSNLDLVRVPFLTGIAVCLALLTFPKEEKLDTKLNFSNFYLVVKFETKSLTYLWARGNCHPLSRSE